ncbi:FKBP-type peptidyl-prolyl cis-trans isomerase [Lysobacter sp. S4-A87]|uniref:FKBP-type peptidyl-prolyl cis-trans isomerase N-terminal domain-containing protein n=1 Tax=Lysobacter sp. S4-A87 TaxID=2925843 RepID=UPI001F53A946|nr:FKBP-type peptidyl-prolyl cis-trans isomerase [Lysobacter sp. S4-A87]UNK50070.1 FKBP-type peptidyl-prolyl cis-trans isomerase [Lysobacter sp. S4-A87]
MKAFVRGAAVLITTAATLFGAAASAQDKTVLTTDRDKASYMVGSDIAQSIAPVAPDIDLAAFERAIKNAFDGGKPLITEDEAQVVGPALMQRIASRSGQAPAGAKVPDVAKDKVAYLVGADVGRSLAPIKDELELPVVVQAIRTSFNKGTPLLSEAEQGAVRQSFQQKVQAKMQAQASALGDKNKADGAAFLAKNKAVKGVFTTGSGLQYMILRQGSGARPKSTDQVRVNYHGTLLDGTVFDSSYDRGQPAEFALNQVIAGWTEGVGMMPVGSKFRFWIPGDLAYGPKGTPGGPIGPNATLVFDVELMSIL